nr:MAG TPA: hypothetical protein [Caudoviricetes sp.]
MPSTWTTSAWISATFSDRATTARSTGCAPARSERSNGWKARHRNERPAEIVPMVREHDVRGRQLVRCAQGARHRQPASPREELPELGGPRDGRRQLRGVGGAAAEVRRVRRPDEFGVGMSGFYRFPAMVLLGDWDSEDQINKVRSETVEAYRALRDCLWDYDTGKRREEPIEADRTAYGMELMDVIHAAETALRMEFSEEEVGRLREKVIEKNALRFYYGKDEQ